MHISYVCMYTYIHIYKYYPKRPFYCLVERETERERIYFKELAHATGDAGKSKVGWMAVNPWKS